jgi:TolB protein
MHRALTVALATLAVWVAATPFAAAQNEIYLEITQPGLRRVAVAAPPLMVLPGTPAEVAASFQGTLDEDLAAAAPIAVVDRKLYSLVEDDPRPEVLHQRWRSIGAQFLVTGTVVRAGGELVVEARLVDLVSGEYAFAKRYRAGVSAAALVAHTMANDLVQVFTGRPGPFLSRIAFISDRSGSSELWVMDWNGSNPKQLTKHGSIALGPAWAPDGSRLIFTSFLRGTPALFELIPQEGYLRQLWSQGGVNSSASFSPDGSQVAFASSVDGNTDIYAISTQGGTARRLTTARGIDTQPAWAPNGRQIAFTSARAGSPQIFLMDSDGSNVRQLTFDNFPTRRRGRRRHQDRVHDQGNRVARHHTPHRGAPVCAGPNQSPPTVDVAFSSTAPGDLHDPTVRTS